MKSFAIVALLATLSAAVPLRQRDYAYETVTNDVVQTTSVTTTVWVDATDGAQTAAVTSAASSAPPASSTPATSTTTQAQEQYQAPAASSASAYSAPATSSQNPAASPSTTAYSTPSSTYQPSTQAPSTTPTSTWVPSSTTPTSTTPTSTWSPTSSAYSTSSAAATTSASSGSGSGSTPCPPGSPCVGEITYFQAGTGACGNTVDGSSDSIIAMPFEMMGSESNGNPFCGKGVKISYGGKTIDAVVQDKCPSCDGNHIDLSEAAFTQLLPEASGTATASWWFAEPTSS
ncbi:MAG: hypothetical protein M1819_002014 [Sarea resinae]|nr:MAG: hypothetical protein M1819_002014 [Sarea resinae]